eukprot:4703232-Amphidinium_carterae.1
MAAKSSVARKVAGAHDVLTFSTRLRTAAFASGKGSCSQATYLQDFVRPFVGVVSRYMTQVTLGERTFHTLSHYEVRGTQGRRLSPH